MSVSLKTLLNKLAQDNLVSLANKINLVHPDCTIDTTVTTTQLRTNMETMLRSNPEYMVNVAGLENVTELIKWKEDHPPPAQSLPSTSDPAATKTPEETKMDYGKLISDILQATSSQHQQILQQMSSHIQLLGNTLKSNKDSHTSIYAFSKEARSRSLSFKGDSGENLLRFLEKVDSLLKSFNLSDEDKVTAVGDLLVSDAETWYCSHRKNIKTWKEFQEALKITYLPKHYYVELRKKILTTRQGQTEKVSHFISRINIMNNQLDQPMKAEILIPVVMSNLHHRFLPLLGMREDDFLSWNELEKSCLRAESILDQQEKAERYQKSTSLKIHSYELGEDNSNDVTSVAAISCYNCKQLGHKHNDCPKPKKIFCYKCGKHGVTSTVCPCQETKQMSISETKLTEILQNVVRGAMDNSNPSAEN